MLDKKVVVWGAGERGNIITSILGEDCVIGYIDRNDLKWGNCFHGRPVFDIEEYKRNYSGNFIIITPVDEEEIVNILHANEIYSYFRMSQVPSELQGYGVPDFFQEIRFPLEKDILNVIYGNNLYSYIIYCDCRRRGYENICFLPDETADYRVVGEMQEKLRCRFIKGDQLPENANILITCRTKRGMEMKTELGRRTADLYDLSDRISRYYNPDILKFKNTGKGKRCFIVATGPSLQMKDLERLTRHNEICFGVNRVFNIKEEIWIPRYYLCFDRMGLKSFWKQIAHYGAEIKFLGDAYRNEEEIEGESYVIHGVTGDSYHCPPRFSDRLEQKVYAYATVTYVAIQLAVYMGFSDIYLLGVDCNYSKNSTGNYFYKEEKADIVNHFEDRMIQAYKTAREYADSHGIKIYNATRGGMLEVFERVDFDQLF